MTSTDSHTDIDPRSVEQALQPLVDELPVSAVRKILSHVSCESLPSETPEKSGRLQAVRGYLISELNRRRPNRVQRLFMSLFEPVLVTDWVLLSAAVPVYGVFQRLDIAALWSHLRQSGLAEQAVETEVYLNAQIDRFLIDDLLRMKETLAHQEKLRERTLDYLTSVAKKKSDQTHMLADINTIRQQSAAQNHGYSEKLAPFDRENFAQIRAYLAQSDALSVAVGGVVSAWDTYHKDDRAPDQGARAVIEPLSALAGELARGGVSERTITLLPLTLVHLRHAWPIVPIWIERQTVSPEARGRMASALLGHLSGSVHCLQRDFSLAFMYVRSSARPEDGAKEPLPILDERRRHDLEKLLERAVAAITTLRSLVGLDELRQTAGTQWQQLRRLMDAFAENRLLPRLRYRLCRPALAADTATAEHETVIWACRLMMRWRMQLADSNEVVTAPEIWRNHLVVAVQEGLRELLCHEGRSTPLVAVRFLAQLDALLRTVDGQLIDHLSLASNNLPALLERRLRDEAPLTTGEAEIAKAVLAMARSEVSASRNWKPRVASRLLETAASVGFEDTV